MDAGPLSCNPVPLLAAIPDPVVVVDSVGRLCWANDTATEELGWPLEDCIGQPVTSLVHSDDIAGAMTVANAPVLRLPAHSPVGSIAQIPSWRRDCHGPSVTALALLDAR